MKNKVITILIVIAVIGGVIFAFYNRINKVVYEKKAIPVDTLKVESKIIDEYYNYQGLVTTSTPLKISFKSSARLEYLGGEKGDLIKAGTEFVKLDTSDLEIALKSSQDKYNQASAAYQTVVDGAKSQDISMLENEVAKAKENVDYLEKLYNDTKQLFDSGYASQNEFDNVTTKLDVAKKDYNSATQNLAKAKAGATDSEKSAAYAGVEAAKTGISANQRLIEDAVYTTDKDKIVVDTMFREGELVPAGYVVAILRDVKEEVIIGVTLKSLDNFKIGTKVRIVGDNKTSEGTVKNIGDIPDTNNLLYPIEIEIEEEGFRLGEIINCEVKVGSNNGIYVPIYSILKDSVNYVYVVEDGKAIIKEVEIIEEVGGEVLVEGLNDGDLVIINNINIINENDKVSVGS